MSDSPLPIIVASVADGDLLYNAVSRVYDLTNALIIIPARGGSKGIPRKNLRSLNGKPLIYYAIRAAIKSSQDVTVYVSSDDPEILAVARQLGAKAHRRDRSLAGDAATLDEVVLQATADIEQLEQSRFDIVVTIQPTSPLLRSASISDVIQRLTADNTVDTVLTAVEDTHLTWRREGDRFLPNYEARVNRQYLTPTYKETGGIIACRRNVLETGTRIGKRVVLLVLDKDEGVDIDDLTDWAICEFLMRRKKILFVVAGYPEIGLGHVYNSLLLANDIVDHDVSFLVDRRSELAFGKISQHNYPVQVQGDRDLVEEIRMRKPHVVINDILDTTADYVSALKRLGIKVINFEDLGPGAKEADAVVNAIYPEKEVLPRHYFGPSFFCLRDEFALREPVEVREKVRSVLLAFGGVDPNNLTRKTLDAIHEFCAERQIEIIVVTGFGYHEHDSIKAFKDVEIATNVGNISEYMARADIVFTSAGRTTYELAALGVPTIVLAQNNRELTHFFATEQYGFTNLGLGRALEKNEILQCFSDMVTNPQSRRYMHKLMTSVDLRGGRARVNRILREVIAHHDDII